MTQVTFGWWFKNHGWKNYILSFIIIAVVDLGFLFNAASILEESGLGWLLLSIVPIGGATVGIIIHMIMTYKRFKKYD